MTVKNMRQFPTILFITQLYPFPPNMGGKFRTLGTIKTLLALHCKVHLVSFIDSSELHQIRMNQETKHRLFKKLSVYSLPSPIIDDLHPVRKIVTYLKSLLSFQPYKVEKYFSLDFLAVIRQIIRQRKPQIVYLDHLTSAAYLPFIKTKNVKYVLDIHDLESQLAYNRSKFSASPLKKFVYLIESYKFSLFEKKVFSIVDKVFVMSSELKKRLVTKLKIPIAIIPILLPLSRKSKTGEEGLKKKKNLQNQITFIGTLSLDDSKIALKWFVDLILPKIKDKMENIKFVIAGSYGADSLPVFLHKGKSVVYIGYQKSLNNVYRKTTVGVVPILVGDTVRMKTLGFLSQGIPVVSTSAGVYGLPGIKDGFNCFITDDPITFANKTISLLRDEKLRRRIGECGKMLVSKDYSAGRLQRFLRKELNL